MTTKNIVVGVDGSDCGKAAVRWATELAGETGADLTLVTGWHWPVSYGVPLNYAGFDPSEDARKVVEAAAADTGLPAARLRTVVQQGIAGDVLVHAARDADLLVVGTRGHSTLGGVLVGSTSTYCVHHAPCPVVVVR